MDMMTFNLRFENDLDGVNGWKNRKELVLEIIERYGPFLVGTQEGTPGQLEYLQDNLTGYTMHAPERVWDVTAQYPTIFYSDTRLRVADGGEFWLSKTPRSHRSKDWDSAFPRMLSYGLFEGLEDGKLFWAAVTHLDHIGVEARREQARIIGSWLMERDGPKILLGDFNDSPSSLTHQILVNRETGLYDTWQELARQETREAMTFHGFQGEPQIYRMDWVLVSRDFKVVDAQIVRDNRDGLYPSGHFPYAVRLEWA